MESKVKTRPYVGWFQGSERPPIHEDGGAHLVFVASCRHPSGAFGRSSGAPPSVEGTHWAERLLQEGKQLGRAAVEHQQALTHAEAAQRDFELALQNLKERSCQVEQRSSWRTMANLLSKRKTEGGLRALARFACHARLISLWSLSEFGIHFLYIDGQRRFRTELFERCPALEIFKWKGGALGTDPVAGSPKPVCFWHPACGGGLRQSLASTHEGRSLLDGGMALPLEPPSQ